MRRHACRVGAWALLALAPALMAAAEDQAQPAPTIEGELARLNRTLERIVGLLERQVEGQQLELTMRRIEVASSLSRSLAEELRRAREQRAAHEEERTRVQGRLASLAEAIESGDESVFGTSPAQLKQYTDQMGLELKLATDRIRDLDLRIAELENELASRRQEIRAWQDLVDRRLGGR